MTTLGTIFATPKQLAAADRSSDSLHAAALAVADREFSGATRRVVGGEVRYYRTAAIYTPAVIRSGGARRWFEVRADGDYPIK